MPLWALCLGRGRVDSDSNTRNNPYSLDNIVDLLHVGLLRTTINEQYQPFLLRDNGTLSTENGRLWLDMSGAEVVVNADVYSYRICERVREQKASMYTTVQAPDRAQFMAWRSAFEVVLRGTRLSDSYRVALINPLAVGQHALLFRGERSTTALPVVVKVVPRALPNSRCSFALTTVSRALRDGLIKNQHLVSVFDVYHTPNETHVVMQMYASSLASYLTGQGPRPQNEVRQLFRQLAGALGAMHQEGFVHGSVVPSNIILEADRPILVRLSGFCLASAPDPRTRDGDYLAPTGRTVQEVLHALAPDGVQYLAPELLLENGALDVMTSSSDFWALGVVLYRALTGELPFLLERVGTEFGSSPPESVLGVMQSYLEKSYLMESKELELLFPTQIKDRLSDDAISLIALLVSPYPDRRRDFNAISQHPWATDTQLV